MFSLPHSRKQSAMLFDKVDYHRSPNRLLELSPQSPHSIAFIATDILSAVTEFVLSLVSDFIMNRPAMPK